MKSENGFVIRYIQFELHIFTFKPIDYPYFYNIPMQQFDQFLHCLQFAIAYYATIATDVEMETIMNEER